MKYGCRPASVYENIGRAPYGVVRDQPDTVRKFSGAMVNSFISQFAIIPSKKRVVKIKKTEADCQLTVMVMKTTLAQDCREGCWRMYAGSGCRMQHSGSRIGWSTNNQYEQRC